MSAREVVVIRTGIANMASIIAGFERAGAVAKITDDPETVRCAKAAILPGVGAFAAGMETLRESGLVEPLRERYKNGAPTLAVCLGLQLLCGTSEESPGIEGLGVVESSVKRFSNSVRVPQLGWNSINPKNKCALIEQGFAYFANSYRLTQAPNGWNAAIAVHDGPFVAAMEKDAMLACQFHPELSGAWGLALLRRWLDLAFSKGESPC